MAVRDWTGWQARREGWITYLPTHIVYGASAVAGLLMLLTPVFVRSLMSAIAICSQAFYPGGVQWGGPAFYGNYLFAMTYVRMLWPFHFLSVLLGVVLGVLRRERGYRFRHIPWRPYEARLRLPIPPHAALMYCLGPLILYAMAAYADRHVYVRLLAANFMFWATSGVLARVLWEAWTDLLLLGGARLGLWRGPHRRLDAECEVRELLEQDPMLSGFRVRDVIVTLDGFARIEAEMTPQQRRRTQELIQHHLPGVAGLEMVPVRIALGEETPVA